MKSYTCVNAKPKNKKCKDMYTCVEKKNMQDLTEADLNCMRVQCTKFAFASPNFDGVQCHLTVFLCTNETPALP